MNTSLIPLLPIVTPQVVTDIIVTLNFSLHSTMLLSLILIVNGCIGTPGGTLIVIWLPLKSSPAIVQTSTSYSNYVRSYITYSPTAVTSVVLIIT